MRGQAGDRYSRSPSRYALGLKSPQLLEERLRRQHHAVADEAGYVFSQNPRGDQMKHGFLPSMTKVWPALWPP